MLDPVEVATIADRFAVSDDQVRRDHLISRLLAALARQVPDAVVFFGGTALARTYLPEGRLSEDIDLYARPARADVVAAVEAALETGVSGRIRPTDLGTVAVRSQGHRPRYPSHPGRTRRSRVTARPRRPSRLAHRTPCPAPAIQRRTTRNVDRAHLAGLRGVENHGLA